ncbi:MAG: rane protein, partial [Bacilli bacterium]|nr:rane protein [Bacilli bacterium]
MIRRNLMSEWIKLRKSNIWLLSLVGFILQLIAGIVLLLNHYHPSPKVNNWERLFSQGILYYGLLFFPLVVGIMGSLMCRAEHLAGGWKQLLVQPVSRSSVYLTKLIYLLMLIALTQILTLAGLLLAGLMNGVHDPLPWAIFFKTLAIGWIAALPIALLQLWVAFSWRNFGAPFALNVILTVPSMMFFHVKEYGTYYPWALPVRLMFSQAMHNLW